MKEIEFFVINVAFPNIDATSLISENNTLTLEELTNKLLPKKLTHPNSQYQILEPTTIGPMYIQSFQAQADI